MTDTAAVLRLFDELADEYDQHIPFFAPFGRDLVAWSWTADGNAGSVRRYVVVVNLSGAQAQAQIPLPWPDLPGREWNLLDLLSGDDFPRDGGQLADPGPSSWRTRWPTRSRTPRRRCASRSARMRRGS